MVFESHSFFLVLHSLQNFLIALLVRVDISKHVAMLGVVTIISWLINMNVGFTIFGTSAANETPLDSFYLTHRLGMTKLVQTFRC